MNERLDTTRQEEENIIDVETGEKRSERIHEDMTGYFGKET
jgi:hypothetical protein